MITQVKPKALLGKQYLNNMPPLITKSLQSLIGSFDDDITFENEDVIEFNFDPLSVNSQGNVIFQDLYDVFNADYRAIMGDEVNLKKLPIVSKSFNRNDSNARENERKYFQFRDAVSEVANSSAISPTSLSIGEETTLTVASETIASAEYGGKFSSVFFITLYALS